MTNAAADKPVNQDPVSAPKVLDKNGQVVDDQGEVKVDTSMSFSTEAEISAWRRYQSNRVAYPDLISLLESGKIPIPKEPSDNTSAVASELRSALKGDEIADNLKQRWKSKLPFTTIGQQILISVNLNNRLAKKKEKEKEYKRNLKKSEVGTTGQGNLGVYDDDEGFLMLLEEDRNLLINDPRANHIVQEHNHAHVFTFATRMYWHMLRDKEDQVVLVTGESGSGKSENVKLIMKQLMHLSSVYARKITSSAAKISNGQDSDTRMAHRLSAAVQVLELLGNAKTALNPNASRMHKYIEMQFSKSGKLVGAKVLDFLMEKKRICHGFPFLKQERNFHIFYEIFAAGQLTREEKERLCLLDGWRAYKYLAPSPKAKSIGSLDKYVDVEFASQGISIKNALRGIGFGIKNIEEILKIISCTMLLGNLDFAIYEAKKEDGAFVKNTDILEKCALLLGVSPEALGTTITQRTSSVGGTICADYLTVEESRRQRDLLAITLYSLLLDHLIAVMNKRMNADNMDQQTTKTIANRWENWIGLLDFGGMETLSVLPGAEQEKINNKYWQFMSNMADDSVQNFIRLKLFADSDKVHLDCNDLTYSLEAVREEGKLWYNGVMKTYLNPSTGLLMQLDSFTINPNNNDASEAKENQGQTDDASAADLIKLFNSCYQSQSKRQSIFLRAFNSGTENKSDAFYMPGGSKTFSIKHYGGATSNAHNNTMYAKKVSYDASDFVSSNKLGGKGRGSLSLKADFVRLLKGTADFTSSKNKFLVTLIDKHVKLMVHPREKRTVITAVKKSSNLSRTPSVRRDMEDKNLTSVKENLESPNEMMRNKLRSITGETATPISATEETTPTQNVESPTATSEFYSDMNSLLRVLKESGQCRFWNVFCVKPNDDLNDKKFNEDRVKEQIRRRDIPLLLLDRTCEFSKTMTWKEFFARYSVIDPSSNSSAAKENGPKGGHKHSSSLASVTLSRTDADVLKAKVRKIYEMYGIITGGGNGKVASSDDLIFMNERTYWALERNLVGIEMKQKKLKPEVEEDAVVPDFLDDDESGSAAQEEQDTEAKVLEKRRKQLERLQLSSQRKWWLRITTFFTWWIPDIVIIKLFKKDRPDVVQAWREKVALCFIIFLLTALMLFMISGFGLILCPPAKIFSKDDLAKNFANQNARKNYMNIHGYVFDVAWIPEAMPGHDWKVLYDYAGKDASKFFPHGTVEECSVFGRIAKRQIRTPPVGGPNAPAPRSPSTTPESTTTEYSIPNDPKHVFEIFKEDVEFGNSKIILAGKFAIAESDIAPRKADASVQWVVLNKNVYDVTRPIATNFFGDDVTSLLQTYAGSDMSSEANTLGSDVLGCLDKRFFIGVIDDRNNIQCTAAGYTLLSLTIILCSVMVAKFLAALQLGAKRAPEETERFVILQIPCYTEGEDSLRKTIRSCALLDYPDDKKLLFIIADGLIKGSGNDRMTPEIVLDILGVENSHEKLTSDVEVPRYDYIALGDGMNRLNRAKIFSGICTVETRQVPYLVVVKCGKESETRRPGNRGKRDSQLIMMKFLNKVHFDREMQPLELEMYRQIKNVIGVDPKLYEYCLMVDADTEVLEDSLNRLVAVFCNDALIMGLCGETQIGNEQDSYITMIQVYEYYISHHLAKAFESLFGSVTCLPGCFCMYRLRTPGRKPQPLLIDDRIIHDYEENVVDTLHKKNLLSLGEDRYLTTLMLKTFPGFRNKFTPDAACRTIVPDKFAVLLSQRRRWINSTIHNLWELLLVPELCGCLCFSMRLVVFLDLFATLTMPGSICYLVYLIYTAASQGSVSTISESLILFGAIYGVQAFIFLVKRKFDMIGWMVIYIMSLPIYGFLLPVYSFWNFDDFSWGNTRLVVGEGRGGHVAEDMEDFDEKKVPVVKWSDFSGEKKQGEKDKKLDAAQVEVAKSSNGLGRQVIKKEQANGQIEVDITEGPVRVPTADPAALSANEVDQVEAEYDNPPNPYELPYAQQSAVFYPQSVVSQGTQSFVVHPSVVGYYPPGYPMYGPPMMAPYYGGQPFFAPPPNQSFYGQPPAAYGQAKPVTPLSANIASPQATNIKVSVLNDNQLKDGIPSSLYPLPNDIHIAFARIIFKETTAIIESSDLKNLTKKKVRSKVETSIKEEWTRLVDAEEENRSLSLSDDWKLLCTEIKNIEELDLGKEERKEWLSKCVNEVLKQISQSKSQ